MPVRSAEAEWQKTLKDGTGKMETESGALKGPFSFGSRFESGSGTNPEELLAAAHAGCFSMQLAHMLSEAGHVADSVQTRARVHLEKEGAGMSVTRIELDTRASVPGVDAGEFERIAREAKEGCIVSRALAAVDISLNAELTT